MKSVSGKELAKALERHGWRLLRITGSHHIYAKTGIEVRVSVPIHANRALKLGLLKFLLKSSGLTEQDL